MGPITLFDKSFLQSLSLDESVWFDNFFITNVCPYFYVETLADLAKTVRKGRTVEQEVSIIADKFPEMSSVPCANHFDLSVQNLLGQKIPMFGQIPVAHGRLVKTEGNPAAVIEPTPEAEAFSRWQKREFMDIEHLYARVWRNAIANLDLDEVGSLFRKLGIDGKSCKKLEDAKSLAEIVVAGRDKPFDRMKLIFTFLGIPQYMYREILERWRNTNYLPLTKFAPYAAFVLTVEVFFQIAIAANLISSDRPSNRVDIAYLFYLPFSMMFVSSDKLHKKCVPLFMRSDQEFIWGSELKKGLKQVNDYYLRFPNEEKSKGVLSFAHHPPKDDVFFVTQLWDKFIPKWRRNRESEETHSKAKSFDEIRGIPDLPALKPDEIDFDPIDVESVTIERRVRKKKGTWHQIAE